MLGGPRDVVGRRVVDLTNGWGGVPPVGEHVVVVTHAPPVDRPFPDAPSTFVTDGGARLTVDRASSD